MAPSFTFLLIIVSCLFCLSNVSYSQKDRLRQGESLHDWEQLVSPGKVFRLGFFSPNPSTLELGSAGLRYVGIWFGQIPFYSVWVANGASPVPDSSGSLLLDSDGKLKITYVGGYSTVIGNDKGTTRTSSASNVVALLLDSGNFVVRQVGPIGVPGRILWQSFDYPDNSLLPGMKLGINLKTGHTWSVTSWLSEKVPSPGAFRFGLDPNGTDQLMIWRRNEVYWSSGLWRNGSFSKAPELTEQNDLFDFKFVSNSKEKYFSYTIKNSTGIQSRWDLDTLGELTRFTLDRENGQNRWMFYTTTPCNMNVSAVCLKEKPSACRNLTSAFVPKRGYFDKWSYEYEVGTALSDCHAKCWNNCSCLAYQMISDDTGCQFYSVGSQFTPDESTDFVYVFESNVVGYNITYP